MTTSRGRFITFEGIDGAGKSSHIEATANWLRARGRQVLLTREPGGTPLAEAVRELFLHRDEVGDVDPLTEALLVFAGRRDHLHQLIVPALTRGVDVLCDRFTDSTFAYQGAGRGFDGAVLGQLEQWVQEGRQPDLTLWFDLPAAVAARRRAAERSADRLEREALGFFERASQGYAARCAAAPRRFVRVDADLARDAVWSQVEAALSARL